MTVNNCKKLKKYFNPTYDFYEFRDNYHNKYNNNGFSHHNDDRNYALSENKNNFCLNTVTQLNHMNQYEFPYRHSGKPKRVLLRSKDAGCLGCVRNSPVPSLMAMVIVLIGVGAFSCGAIMAKNRSTDVFNWEDYSKGIDYIIYGIIVATVMFVILAYILAAFSTGYNRKRHFEGSRKTKAGRCCTGFNLFCIFLGIIFWVLMFGLMSVCTYLFLLKHKPTTEMISNNAIFMKNLNASMLTNSTDAGIDRDTVIEILVAYCGCLFAIIGFILMLCCASMNFVRLGEERYYADISYSRHKPDQPVPKSKPDKMHNKPPPQPPLLPHQSHQLAQQPPFEPPNQPPYQPPYQPSYQSSYQSSYQPPYKPPPTYHYTPPSPYSYEPEDDYSYNDCVPPPVTRPKCHQPIQRSSQRFDHCRRRC